MRAPLLMMRAMRGTIRAAAICAALVSLAPAAFAADMGNASDDVDPDAPTVGASLDKSEAHVGDRLLLTVSAVAKSNVAVTLPQSLDLGKLEVLDRNEGDRNGRDLGDGRRSHRFVLAVSAYETGELEVPPIPVTYSTPNGEVKTVTTDALPLTIRPLVAADEPNADVQPVRPPRSAWVPDERVIRALKWGGVGLGGAIVLVGGLLLVRRARKRRVPVAEAVAAGPRRPPDAVAIEKLTALRQKGDFGADGYRPFYFALTDVVREYLGARYGFDALDMTTTELLDELSRRAAHLTAAGADVPRFFADCDLVKFAKAGSTDGDALLALDAAQAIVLSTAAPLEELAHAISGPVRMPRNVGDGTGGGNG
jgi:hypothetical protein